MDYITAKDMAKIWGITPRRVALLCAQKRIECDKVGKVWLIHKDTKKPLDKRTVKKMENNNVQD